MNQPQLVQTRKRENVLKCAVGTKISPGKEFQTLKQEKKNCKCFMFICQLFIPPTNGDDFIFWHIRQPRVTQKIRQPRTTTTTTTPSPPPTGDDWTFRQISQPWATLYQIR
jgi:hypothetical protein